MGRAGLVGALLTFVWCGVASPQTTLDGTRVLACVPSEATRDLYLAKKLMQPARVMREAAAAARAEAIAIQLCWFGGALVYDVTLLQSDGRVTHRLTDAATGVPLAGGSP